ncbi:MAG: ribokinase [Burkholderiales bacterium]|nr:ribokinase [Anaerolineae bacterium]
MAAKIVVVGDFNADLVTYLKRLPRPGETLNGHNFLTGSGGKGSNQAIAAARLGADVTFVGRVGQDSFAEIGLKLWQQENINTDYLVRDFENPSGIATIFVGDDGENMIVVAQGANLKLSPADVDEAVSAIARADVLITQLGLQFETVAHALKVAKEQGTVTILNPAPAGALSPDVLALADYITPNEGELRALTPNVDAAADAGIEEAARSLLTHDAQTVVVTLGANGACWVQRGGSDQVPAFKAEVVDTVGAGDAFNAAFAVALAEGKALPEALRFANAAAAICVTRPGAAAAMPARAEVDELLSS